MMRAATVAAAFPAMFPATCTWRLKPAGPGSAWRRS